MHAVLANFRPRELWLGAIPPNQTLSQLLRQAKEQNITVVQHFQGDTFAFGGATVRVLAPARDWRTAQQPRNNDSLVLHVSYRESSVLMEGDAEKRIEERISALQPHADVLKVAHHGGATSSIPDLLQAVRPRMAVISVGARNSFGHPRLEVLQRFEELGVATYRTDLDGAVTFYLDGRSVNPAMAALR
jgi:competence protein ComEC